MNQCTAAGCDAGTADGIYLCDGDTATLEYRLAEVQAVWDDLQDTLARMDKAASVPGGGTADSRPPVNLDALDHAQQLRTVLRGMVMACPGLSPATSDVPKVVAWLMHAAQIRALVGSPDAGDHLADLTRELRASEQATDRAAERITLGACHTDDCPGTLTANHGAQYARCKTCGYTIEVREQQQWLIGEAWHVAAPLPLIIRALRESGNATIPLERAKKWVQRGKVVAVACDVPSRSHLFATADVYRHYQTTTAAKRDAA